MHIMEPRKYYSERSQAQNDQLTLNQLNDKVLALFSTLDDDDYFAEAFGDACDSIFSPYFNPPAIIHPHVCMTLDLGKENLWPFVQKPRQYSEDDIFDVIEWLYDYVSMPTERITDIAHWEGHNFTCHKLHATSFDRNAGQQKYRKAINRLIEHYASGYQLTKDGEIVQLSQPGLEDLLNQELPGINHGDINQMVRSATARFRARHANIADKRSAIKELADVLEYLRPHAKLILKDDEGDLFNIANNFGIRHHNTKQQTDYDKDVWYPWIFYVYLASIHAILARIYPDNPAGISKSSPRINNDATI